MYILYIAISVFYIYDVHESSEILFRYVLAGLLDDGHEDSQPVTAHAGEEVVLDLPISKAFQTFEHLSVGWFEPCIRRHLISEAYVYNLAHTLP